MSDWNNDYDEGEQAAIEKAIQKYNSRLYRSLLKDKPDRFELSEFKRQEQWAIDDYNDVPHENITNDLNIYIDMSPSFSTFSRTSKKIQYKRAVRTPHCWKCKTALDGGMDEECPSCGWIICPSCGACEFNCHTGFERMGGKEPVREFTATPKPSDDVFNEPNRDICGKYRSGECFALGDCKTCSDFIQIPLATLKY